MPGGDIKQWLTSIEFYWRKEGVTITTSYFNFVHNIINSKSVCNGRRD